MEQTELVSHLESTLRIRMGSGLLNLMLGKLNLFHLIILVTLVLLRDRERGWFEKGGEFWSKYLPLRTNDQGCFFPNLIFYKLLVI